MKNLVLGKKYFLIEALGNTIASGILAEFPKVSKVLIRVRKHSPPVKGVVDYVEAEIERSRS
jgi:dihydroneopterin aldolase